MANCYYKGKEVRSRSDRDREVKLSWAHTVTLINTDINFKVTGSVVSFMVDNNSGSRRLLNEFVKRYRSTKIDSMGPFKAVI